MVTVITAYLSYIIKPVATKRVADTCVCKIGCQLHRTIILATANESVRRRKCSR